MRTHLNLAATAGLAVWLAATSAAGQADEPAISSAEDVAAFAGLEALAPAALDGFEPAVREQLLEAYQQLEPAASAVADAAEALGEAYGALGMHLHAYGLVDDAAAAYRNAHRLAADDPRWTFYLGDLAERSGDLDTAAAQFEAVLEAQPDDVATSFRLGELELDRGRLDAASRHLDRAAELAPGDAAIVASRGRLALARNDAAAAVELLEQALEAVPAATRLNHPLGLAYRQLGDLERARSHLAARGEVGIKIGDPRLDALDALKTGERVHLLRGRTAFAAGRFGEAAEAFRQAAEADEQSARARVNLGTALARVGDAVAAEDAYRAALEIEPSNPTALFNLAQLIEPRDPEQALVLLERAVAERPEDGEAHRELALLLRRAGRFDEAIQQFRYALQADAEDEAAHLGLAVLLVQLERYREAIDGLDAANGILPHAGRIAAALARLLAASPDLSLRDGERALALAEPVITAAPTPEHAQLLALALAEAGRCAEAASWQEKAIAAAETADPAQRQAMVERLEHYRRSQPCRPPGASRS